MNIIIASFLSQNALTIFALILCGALAILLLNLQKTKRKLQEKENDLRAIFQSEPDCVKLQTIDGSVIDMNSAGLAILEAKDLSEVSGHTVYEFIDSKYHDDYRELTKRVFQGNTEMMEFKIHSKSGRERWLETNALPLRDRQNNITALLAITRDITLRKELEQKLKQRQMDLERVCRVNTMGEVASGIAHEINQPLCAISSYAETCIAELDSGNTNDLKENLKLIFEQSQKASGIVSWVRELAENKKCDLQELNISDLINEFMKYVEFYLDENNVKLKVNNVEKNCFIYADRAQLEHVLMNVIKNSVDAMSCNAFDRIIELDLKSIPDSDKVIIYIKDKGVGIHNSNINKVTTPYFSTKSDGLGMGLPISKSIMKAHYGDLWIDESSRNGTTIAFSLKKVKTEIHESHEQCA